MLPDKLKVSPTEPVPPEPVDIMDTAKSSFARAPNISFVPAVIVASPFEDSVAVNCLLTLKLVSV